MQKTSKIILGLSFLIALGLFFNINAPSVEAATAEELEAMIVQLQAQLAALQEQLDELRGGTGQWCHDFDLNLRYGDIGNEVQALQTALEKEGFNIPDSEKKGVSYFGNHTASAVVGFQEKYAEDILAPWGLAHGTGYVGTTTRAKLNELYGCAEEPYIRVFSPNGGEELAIGARNEARWESNGVGDEVKIVLLRNDGPVRYDSLFLEIVVPNTGYYSYQLPSDLLEIARGYVGDNYSIGIEDADDPSVYDESDGYFSIVEETCHTSDLWDWEYCTPDCKCYAGEGDCDTNADCYTGYCAQDVGEDYGQVSSMDVCEEEEVTSITVLSPNGGEEWVRNTSTDSDTCSVLHCEEVEWSGGSGTDYYLVDAYLERLESGQFVTVGKIPAFGYGSISWPVGVVVPVSCVNPWHPDMYQCSKSLVDPGEYYMRIVDRETGVQDRSDASFSIVGQETPVGSLTISTAADTPAAQNITKGSTNVTFLKGKFAADDVEDIRVDALNVCVSSPPYGTPEWANSENITNVRLSDNTGSIIGTTQEIAASGCAFFGDLNWLINKNTVETLGVKADVSFDAGVSSLSLFVSGKSLITMGMTSGEQVNVAGSIIGSEMTIVEPEEQSITVQFPNGGEKWVIGNRYKISWEQSGLDNDYLYIELQGYKEDGTQIGPGSGYQIASGVPAKQGYYYWGISSSFYQLFEQTPAKYKIRLANSYQRETMKADKSDDYFFIYENAYDIVPEMVYPVDGQTLDLEGSYMFKVKPMGGATPYSYLYGFFQDDVMIYENWRDDRQLSTGGEFAVHPDNPYHSEFHEGDLKVMIRALIGGQWTDSKTLNLKLVPRIDMKEKVCAAYFRKTSSSEAIQGTWTEELDYTNSIGACYDYMKENILDEPNCAQPDGEHVTVVLIDKSKHTFYMPDIDMSTEFVCSQFCE